MSTPPATPSSGICPPAPRRPAYVPLPQPRTTPIVIMQIDIRKHGWADENVDDEDDETEWMRTNLYFTDRHNMELYFEYLYRSGCGNGFEEAIILHIENNSTLGEFLEKISSLKDSWEINKNLRIYVHDNVIIN